MPHRLVERATSSRRTAAVKPIKLILEATRGDLSCVCIRRQGPLGQLIHKVTFVVQYRWKAGRTEIFA